MSDLEERLLYAIRMAHGWMPQPKREYRFIVNVIGGGPGVRKRLAQAGLRDYRFDFAWTDVRLAVEVNGGVWMDTDSGHKGGVGQGRDFNKLNIATALGWAVLQFAPHDLRGYTLYASVDIIAAVYIMRGGWAPDSVAVANRTARAIMELHVLNCDKGGGW